MPTRCLNLRWVLFALLSINLTAIACMAADAPATKKLVIVKAYYGDLPDGAKTDVSDKVASRVQDDVVTVEATNDNFGDPAEGISKKLKVDFTLDGVAHSKTVDENQTMTISGKPTRLVIIKAVYGDLPDGAKVDVTDRVFSKVENNSLSIGATNDNFGDPVDGTAKKLRVDYTFDGKAKSKTVDENDTLTISTTGE